MVKKDVKKWLGTWPAPCDICKKDLLDEASSVDEHGNLNGYFVDGQVAGKTAWALMCPECFTTFGVGLGKGKGQKYAVRSPGYSEHLVKIEG